MKDNNIPHGDEFANEKESCVRKNECIQGTIENNCLFDINSFLNVRIENPINRNIDA